MGTFTVEIQPNEEDINIFSHTSDNALFLGLALDGMDFKEC